MRKIATSLGLIGTIVVGSLYLGTRKEPYRYSSERVLNTRGMSSTLVDDIDNDGLADLIVSSTPFTVNFYDPAKKEKIQRMNITFPSSARPLPPEVLKTASDYLAGEDVGRELEYQLNKLRE